MTEDETQFSFEERAFIASCMAGSLGTVYAGLGLLLAGV